MSKQIQTIRLLGEFAHELCVRYLLLPYKEFAAVAETFKATTGIVSAINHDAGRIALIIYDHTRAVTRRNLSCYIYLEVTTSIVVKCYSVHNCVFCKGLKNRFKRKKITTPDLVILCLINSKCCINFE